MFISILKLEISDLVLSLSCEINSHSRDFSFQHHFIAPRQIFCTASLAHLDDIEVLDYLPSGVAVKVATLLCVVRC